MLAEPGRVGTKQREHAVDVTTMRSPLPVEPVPEILRFAQRYAPSLYLDVGNVCNLSCTYCCVPRPELYSARTEDLEWVAERAARVGIRKVAFIGGEPTVHKGFLPMVGHLRRQGMREIILTTNGLKLARRETVDRMLDEGVSMVHLSLDAFDPDIARRMLGSERAPDLLGQALENLLPRQDVPLYLYSVVCRPNLAHMPEYVRRVADLQQRHGRSIPVVLAALKPSERAWDNRDDLLPPVEDVAAMARRVIREARDEDVTIALKHLPSCLLGDLQAHNLDLYLEDGRVSLDHGGALPPVRSEVDVKGPPCGECSWEDVCYGVHRDYVASHGWEAFAAGLERAAVRQSAAAAAPPPVAATRAPAEDEDDGKAREADRADAMLVFVHPSRRDSVRSSVLFANVSGELRDRGLQSEVVELLLEFDDPEATDDSFRHLREHIRARRPRVVILDEVADSRVFDEVRAASDGYVVLVSPGRFNEGTVDFVVRHFGSSPGPLLTLVSKLAEGADPLPSLPNVGRVKSHGEVEWLGPELRKGAVPVYEALPDVERTIVPPIPGWDEHRVTLFVNAGCPWNSDAHENPEFGGDDVSPVAVTDTGCTFCPMGGDYTGLSRRQTVSRILDEMRVYMEARPNVRELILRDQSTLRFLPELVDGLHEHGFEPMTILFSLRADTFLHHSKRLQLAIDNCRGTGVSLELYLIGAESFADPELRRMGKGYTGDELEQAMEACRDLAREAPDIFIFDRNRTWSFILFTPWTSLDDLRRNIASFRRQDVLDFSAWPVHTKLRLYEFQPLYGKAVREGLIKPRYETGTFDSAKVFGYAAEHPYEFAHPEVGPIYEGFFALFPHIHPDSQVALLDWLVTRSAAGHGDTLEDLVGPARAIERLRDIRPGRPAGDRPAHTEAAKAEKKEKKPEEPRAEVLVVRLGETCNNGCGACVRDRRTHGHTLEEARARLAWRTSDRFRVRFDGREPLLVQDLGEYVRAALDEGAEGVECVTNGLLFAYPAMIRRVEETGLTDVHVKVFGATAETYEAATRSPGAFRAFERAMKNLGKRSRRFTVHPDVVVRPENVHELAQMDAWLRELGFDVVCYRVPVTGWPVSDLDRVLSGLEDHLRALAREGGRFVVKKP